MGSRCNFPLSLGMELPIEEPLNIYGHPYSRTRPLAFCDRSIDNDATTYQFVPRRQGLTRPPKTFFRVVFALINVVAIVSFVKLFFSDGRIRSSFMICVSYGRYYIYLIYT